MFSVYREAEGVAGVFDVCAKIQTAARAAAELDDRDRAVLDRHPLVTDHSTALADFADTAALLSLMDLVISVDTAVAHLAGALGKPVWNFVRFSGYWQWLSAEAAGDPEKSIWYPSMKLVRQPSLANWQEPIERVTGWLKAMVPT